MNDTALVKLWEMLAWCGVFLVLGVAAGAHTTWVAMRARPTAELQQCQSGARELRGDVMEYSDKLAHREQALDACASDSNSCLGYLFICQDKLALCQEEKP
jgi:hypothetical protein